MNGSKGITIVVVALLLTVCVGYLANYDDEETEKTVYNDIANLDAVFYANSDRVQSSELYNSVYNVTGWSGNATVPQSSQVSQYIISAQTTEYTTSTLEYDLTQYTYATGVFGGQARWLTTADGVYQKTGDTYTDGTVLHGGIYGHNNSTSGNTTVDNYLNFTVNGTVAMSGYTMLFVDLKTVVDPTDGLRINARSEMLYDYTLSTEWTSRNNSSYTHYYYYWNTTVDSTEVTNASYIEWNAVYETWYVYDSSDNVIMKTPKILLYTYDATSAENVGKGTLTLNTPSIVPSTYADPVGFTSIAYGKTGTWSNNTQNSSLVNTSVSFFALGSFTATYGNIMLDVSISGGVLSYRLSTQDGIFTLHTIWHEVGTYPGAIVTIDNDTDTVSITGVLSYSDSMNYTTSGIEYSLTSTSELGSSFEIEDTTTIAFKATDSAGLQIRILDTYVLTDPNGLLWQDFSVNLSSYLADSLSSLRILLNGFVSYGDSITVNGETYAVTNDKISVRTDTEYGYRYQTMPLKGMAVEYRDGHTYLIFTESANKTVDLGETTDYILAGAGVWYFEVSAYTIDHTIGTKHVWSPGWTLDTNAAALIYLALIGAIFAAALYFRRDSFGVIDWAVLIITAIMAVSLVVL